MDPDGRFWDTVWDICVTIFDFGKAIYKSSNGDNSGWIDVSLDAAALLLPCVPAGLSKVDDVVKFAKNGDEIASTTKYVFWTGMGDNGTKAANWVKQNGGITLEMTEIGKKLPDWSPANASKWDAASLDFAKECKGDVTVLVGSGGIRDSSTFSRIEFSELLNNKNVDSINFVYIE